VLVVAAPPAEECSELKKRRESSVRKGKRRRGKDRGVNKHSQRKEQTTCASGAKRIRESTKKRSHIREGQETKGACSGFCSRQRQRACLAGEKE